jgi:hypothetical protein
VAYRGHPMADVHREIGIFAALDAQQEIIVLAFRIGVETQLVEAGRFDVRNTEFKPWCLAIENS